MGDWLGLLFFGRDMTLENRTLASDHVCMYMFVCAEDSVTVYVGKYMHANTTTKFHAYIAKHQLNM